MCPNYNYDYWKLKQRIPIIITAFKNCPSYLIKVLARINCEISWSNYGSSCFYAFSWQTVHFWAPNQILFNLLIMLKASRAIRFSFLETILVLFFFFFKFYLTNFSVKISPFLQKQILKIFHSGQNFFFNQIWSFPGVM